MSRSVRLSLVLAAFASSGALVVGGGCRSEPSVPGGVLSDAAVSIDAASDGGLVGCDLSGTPQDVDILLVVGNGDRSAATQRSLIAGLPVLFAKLACDLGAQPNVHVGVVSTNLGAAGFPIPRCDGSGDDGLLLSEPQIAGCRGPEGSFLIDRQEGAERTRNFEGRLDEAATCIASLGSDGCSFEQPLAAAVRATDETINPGFLRDDALLAIIVASGGDDCSAESGNLFNPSVPALGPLSTFRCFEQGVQCSPDEPRQAGAKTDCTPREPSSFVTPVSELVATLTARKADPSKVVIGYLGGFPDAVAVINRDGQNSVVAACPAPFDAAPNIRLGAIPGATAGLLCSESPAAIAPISDAIADAAGGPEALN